MTEREKIHSLVWQLDCGLLDCGSKLRAYFKANLDHRAFQDRLANRNLRRFICTFKILLLFIPFGLVLKELSLLDADGLYYLAALCFACCLGNHRSVKHRERLCQEHFDCLQQLSLGQLPAKFPFDWQAGAGAYHLKEFSDGIEWDLEWKLRKRESRVSFLVLVSLAVYLCLLLETLETPFLGTCGWGYLG